MSNLTRSANMHDLVIKEVYENKTKSDLHSILSYYKLVGKDTALPNGLKPDLVNAWILKKMKFAQSLICSNSWVNQITTIALERSILEGPKFNDAYDSIQKFCRQARFGINWRLHAPEEWPENMEFIAEDWDDFINKINEVRLVDFGTPELLFPAQFLYPWVDPKPEAIEILETTQPDCQLDLGLCEEIITELLSPVDKDYSIVDFVISHTNFKMAVDPNKKKTGRKYDVISRWIDFMKEKDFAKRTPVWKQPTEYRDAVTLSPSLLFKVWRTNNLIADSCKSPSFVKAYTRKTLSTLRCKFKYCLQTDWKKSGLTLPHWFVKLSIKCFNKVNKIKILEEDFPTGGWDILDDTTDKVFKPNGLFGYSLGMVNSFCTLFNIMLYKYATRSDILNDDSVCLSFNDDSAIFTDKPNYFSWIDLCVKSGARLDKAKTFVSKHGCLFLEIHSFEGMTSSKLIQFFHTMLVNLVTSFNKTHWSFVSREIWLSYIKIREPLDKYMIAYGQSYNGLIEDYVSECTSLFYDYPDGVGNPLEGKFGFGFVSEFGNIEIKTDLISTYFGSELQVILKQNAFREYIEWKDDIPVSAPWKPFPSGDAKDWLRKISSFPSCFIKSSSITKRIDNKFDSNSMEHERIRWEKIDQMVTGNYQGQQAAYSEDFTEWALNRQWPGELLPPQFVTKSVPVKLPDCVWASFPENKSGIWSNITSMLMFDLHRESKIKNLHKVSLDEAALSDPYKMDFLLHKSGGQLESLVSVSEFDKLMSFQDNARLTIVMYLSIFGEVPVETRLPANALAQLNQYICEKMVDQDPDHVQFVWWLGRHTFVSRGDFERINNAFPTEMAKYRNGDLLLKKVPQKTLNLFVQKNQKSLKPEINMLSFLDEPKEGLAKTLVVSEADIYNLLVNAYTPPKVDNIETDNAEETANLFDNLTNPNKDLLSELELLLITDGEGEQDYIPSLYSGEGEYASPFHYELDEMDYLKSWLDDNQD